MRNRLSRWSEGRRAALVYRFDRLIAAAPAHLAVRRHDMQTRYKLLAVAVAILLCIAIAIVLSVRAPAGVTLTFLGYGSERASRDRLSFVVTNDSTRTIHISSDPIEFHNTLGWWFLGPQINFSPGEIIVSETNIAPGETFHFSVTQPSEPQPWRVSLRWFTPYNKHWWRVQRFADICLRRMSATPPFTHSGVLKGPELPYKPPNPRTLEPTPGGAQVDSHAPAVRAP